MRDADERRGVGRGRCSLRSGRGSDLLLLTGNYRPFLCFPTVGCLIVHDIGRVRRGILFFSLIPYMNNTLCQIVDLPALILTLGLIIPKAVSLYAHPFIDTACTSTRAFFIVIVSERNEPCQPTGSQCLLRRAAQCGRSRQDR